MTDIDAVRYLRVLRAEVTTHPDDYGLYTKAIDHAIMTLLSAKEFKAERDALLLKTQEHGKSDLKFTVIDHDTGKEADPCKLATESWAKELCYCDIEGFAIGDDGSLYLLDECGAWAYCPEGRFEVVMG